MPDASLAITLLNMELGAGRVVPTERVVPDGATDDSPRFSDLLMAFFLLLLALLAHLFGELVMTWHIRCYMILHITCQWQ